DRSGIGRTRSPGVGVAGLIPSLQQHLPDIWQQDRPTMLFVSHDIDEALMLADRVIVLLGRPGRVRRDERIDLPRPRRLGDPRLARWRERLFDDLTGLGEDCAAPALRLAHAR